MKRKGFEPSAVMMIVLVVLGGVIVGGATNQLISVQEDKTDELEGELDNFHRSIELTTDHHELAKGQLRATNYLVTLRSVHCSSVQNAVYGTTIEGKDKDEGNVAENSHVGFLSYAFTLQEPSVRNLECRGQDSIYEVTGINNAIEKIEDLADCADSPVKCYIGNTYGKLAEKAASGLGKVPVVGGYFSGDEDVNCFICNQSVNDQPGRYGNVKFTYPKAEGQTWAEQQEDGDYAVSGQQPIVLNAENDLAAPEEHLPVRNYVTVKDDEGYEVEDIDNVDNWNAWSDPELDELNENGEQTFWTDGKIRFAPDPMIARYTRENSHDLDRNYGDDGELANPDYEYDYDNAIDPPNNCNEYPIKPFRTAMVNVPLLTNKPLYERISSDTNIPLSKDVKSGAVTCRGARGSIPPFEDEDNLDHSLHADYEFVICPGSEGRIQSNAGLPYHTGKALPAEDWSDVERYEPSDDKYEGETAGENTVYPRIELTGTPSQNAYCIQDYITGFTSQRLETRDWVNLEDLEGSSGDSASFELQDMPQSAMDGNGFIYFVGSGGDWYGLTFDYVGTDDEIGKFSLFSRHMDPEFEGWKDMEDKIQEVPLLANAQYHDFTPQGTVSDGSADITLNIEDGYFSSLKFEHPDMDEVKIWGGGNDYDVVEEDVGSLTLTDSNIQDSGAPSSLNFDLSNPSIVFTNWYGNLEDTTDDSINLPDGYEIESVQTRDDIDGYDNLVTKYNIANNGQSGDNQNSGIPEDVKQAALNKADFECNSYRHLGLRSEAINGIRTKQVSEGGQHVFQYRCGLEAEEAYDKTYWKFKKYIRLVSRYQDPGSLKPFFDNLPNGEHTGRLAMPESVRIYSGEPNEENTVDLKFKSTDDYIWEGYPIEGDCSEDEDGNNILKGGDFYRIDSDEQVIECLNIQSQVESSMDSMIERINTEFDSISGDSGSSSFSFSFEEDNELPDTVSINVCEDGGKFCYSAGGEVDTSNSVTGYDVSISINSCDGEGISSESDSYSIEATKVPVSPHEGDPYQVSINCD